MAGGREDGGVSFTENLDAFFGDLSVLATIVTGTSTSTASVYFDNPSMFALNGAAVMDAPSVIAQESAGLVRGSTVTISAVGYTVRAVEKLDDGALVRATLEAA